MSGFDWLVLLWLGALTAYLILTRLQTGAGFDQVHRRLSIHVNLPAEAAHRRARR